MKSSTNWAGIVMGARLFIPKVVFAFLFSLPRIIIFIFVSSAACAFWFLPFFYYYYTWATHQQSVCVCGQNMKFSYSFFFLLRWLYKSFFYILHIHTYLLRILFVNFILYFWVEKQGKEDE